MTPAHRMKTFREHLPELLPKHEGKYALVHDGQMTIHDSHEEATRLGFEKYGKINDFLVVKIEPPDPCTGPRPGR